MCLFFYWNGLELGLKRVPYDEMDKMHERLSCREWRNEMLHFAASLCFVSVQSSHSHLCNSVVQSTCLSEVNKLFITIYFGEILARNLISYA